MEVFSAHIDTFVRDNLPDESVLPEFRFDLPDLNFPDYLNAACELLDRHVIPGLSDRIALLSDDASWTYQGLAETTNQLAHVLTNDMKLVPGNRVLLVGPNSPMLVASWLAVLKAGGVAVAAMPMLRAKDYATILAKAEISHAICDFSVASEIDAAAEQVSCLKNYRYYDETRPSNCDLQQSMAAKPKDFLAIKTTSSDPAIIAFTSGTTGDPKGCVHFHRDILAMSHTFSRHILRPNADDRFLCSAPLAFTFGLGMNVVFPLMVGASAVLLRQGSPAKFGEAIGRHRVTIAATAPTGYRALLKDISSYDASSLRLCVSAGEHLPEETFIAWEKATGMRLVNGIGATEMIHIFISSSPETCIAGAIGKAVPGYTVNILDKDLKRSPTGDKGFLAVKGPTGCRYLTDARQSNYVQGGWNLTGDICHADKSGNFWYHGRADDMIVSSGYNISALEVEEAVLKHPGVSECAVIGVQDEARGMLVKAFVVPAPEMQADEALVKDIQNFVKNTIAPYKYPRSISFLDSLPKTNTGKLKRGNLKK